MTKKEIIKELDLIRTILVQTGDEDLVCANLDLLISKLKTEQRRTK